MMNKDQSQTTLLNWLDVGEFGGGTRFITQPNIFHSTEHPMASRFNFKIISQSFYDEPRYSCCVNVVDLSSYITKHFVPVALGNTFFSLESKRV